MGSASDAAEFRAQLRAGNTLIGTFVKSACYPQIEIIAASGLDFIVFDAEHAPFDRNGLDVCLMAARTGDLPALVRIPNTEDDTIGSVLDMGAAGIVVPHVTDAQKAAGVVAATRYSGGRRGFSGSPRASGYGAVPMPELLATADESVSVLCQIEDRLGVENVEEIAGVEGVDCLFIGRADLAVAYGAVNVDHPSVDTAVDAVLETGQRVGQRVGIFLVSVEPVANFVSRGLSLFVVGSDQSLLRAGAANMVSAARELVSSAERAAR